MQEVDGMTRLQANKMMRTLWRRDKHGYCSFRQMRRLKGWGVPTSRVYRRQAKEALGYIDRCVSQGEPVDVRHVEALATGA